MLGKTSRSAGVGVGGIVLCLLLIQIAAAATKRPAAIQSADAAAPLTYSSDQPDQVTIAQPVTAHFQFSSTSGAVTVISAALAGPNGPSYSIVSNACDGALLQGATLCEIDVQYDAIAPYDISESLVLSTNAGPYTVDLSVDAEPLPLIATPAKTDFGTVTLDTTVTKNVVFSNPNPIDIDLDIGYDGFGGGPDFDSSKIDICDHIPANSSCTVPISFTPTVDAAEGASWFAAVQYRTQPPSYAYTLLSFTGTGVMPGAVTVSLDSYFNVDTMINEGSRITPDRGIDGDSNVYAENLLTFPAQWSGHQFNLGARGVTAASIILPSGYYYGVSFLATGVNGDQQNQSFVVTYMDGSSQTLLQSLSDWKTPQHYANEEIAAVTAYRLNISTGVPHTGPYYMYGYTLPIDHNKAVASIKLPRNKDVVLMALDLVSAPLPTRVDLSHAFNVDASRHDGTPATDAGIDGDGDAISYEQIADTAVAADLPYTIPAPNALDAVSASTIALPPGMFSSLRLLGAAVNGNRPNQTLVIRYTDGTTATVTQSFSDWHTPQSYSAETNAIGMIYRLTKNGGHHPGAYYVYEYSLPLDATKFVASVMLPGRDVIVLSMSLVP